jgi:hypothetical protein
MAEGLFRDADDWVRVRFGDGHEIDLPRKLYAAARYDPPFHELPLAAELSEPPRKPDAGAYRPSER